MSRRSRWRWEGVLLAALLAAAPAGGAGISEIRDCVRENAPKQSAVLRVTIEVEERDGSISQTRARVIFRRYADDPSRLLVRMELPEDLAGTALLVISPPGRRPSAYMYSPDLGKPRKLTSVAQARSVLTSDLPVEEIRQLLDITERTTMRLLGEEHMEGRATWQVEATLEATADSAYRRMRAWIDRETCVPLRIDFIGEQEGALKTMRIPPERLIRIGGSWIPQEVLVRELGPGRASTLRLEDIEIDVPFPPGLLTPKALALPGGP